MDINQLPQEIREADPIKSANLVSGLLLVPRFHANTFRLELLIHFLVSHSGGKQHSSSKRIQRWLNNFNPISSAFYMEDPVEDVFVSRVMTQWGDYRIYNGLWEGNDFYLQKVLDTIQSVPPNLGSDSLFKPVHMLLCLSEEVARRNKATLYQIAESHDKEQIYVPNIETLKRLAKTLTFSRADIERMGVSIEDLTAFVFDPNSRENLRDQQFGNTDLERFPLLFDGNKFILVLPTAVSVAIRRYIFEWLDRRGMTESFERNYVGEYIKYLQETPILGKPVPSGLPLRPEKISEAYFLEFMAEIDKGRYLHVLIRIDTLHGLLKEGMDAPPPHSQDQSEEIERRILAAKDSLTAREGFKDGLSLIVSAGYGRPTVVTMSEKISGWNFEFISAHDLETMGWIPGATDISLWKLLEQKRKLTEYNVQFFNINGLLNLYGWWEQSDYLLVPDNVEVGTVQNIIYVPTDCLAKVRQETREAGDLHSETYIDGTLKRLRRKSLSSLFAEDKNIPLYAGYEDMGEGELTGCAITKNRPWWVKLERDETALDSDACFRIWDALHDWMNKISSILDGRFSTLMSGPIFFVLDLSALPRYERLPENPPSASDSLIDLRVDQNTNLIKLKLKEPFLYNLHNPLNISEKALVRACIQGFLALVNHSLDDSQIDKLCDLIIPNQDARYIHFFKAHLFREHIRAFDRCGFEKIENFDTGIIKIGLGHLDGVLGHREIKGKDECTSFLEKIVKHSWDNLKRKLKEYNRESLITAALRNIEGVAAEKEEWKRTARAVLVLHEDKEDVYNVTRDHFSGFYAADVACRIIVETAICECPLDGGAEVGRLDLSPLMSMASLIFHLGNISDAIDKGVTEPRIVVSASGEIKTEQTFHDEVLIPFSARFEKTSFASAADRYERHFEDVPAQRPLSEVFTLEFLSAFEKETGVSAEILRRFREEMENMAEKKEKSVFTARKSEIIAYCEKGMLCSGEDAINILNAFSLRPRKNWEIPPPGYKSRDISPWLFRRRLSLLMKPFIRIEDAEDPRFIISPGLTGEALAYILDTYNRCNIEESRCNSPEMIHWIGEERGRRGHEFNKEVAASLEPLGYEAHPDIKVSSIIPRQDLDRDYGDIDVIAWRNGEKSIYVIECKDLFYAKTSKEIAEQLLEFKGEDRDGKPDRLKKHLLRIDVLSKHKDRLLKFCKLNSEEVDIVPYVIFSNPVPVLYDTSPGKKGVRFGCLDDILRDGL